MKKMYLFALLALTTLSFGQDLIVDGGFETQVGIGAATTPWYSGNGGITFVTTNVKSGSRALQWGTTFRSLHQAITATPGTTYICTYYVRSNESVQATGDNTVYVGITDGSNTSLVPPIVGMNAPWSSSSNGYVKYTFTFTAPQANLTLAMSKGTGNGTVNLDDISIVEGSLSTLTSTGAYSAAFSGSAQTPTFTANPVVPITYSYRGIGTTYNSATAPSAVGNYTAVAYVENGTGRDYLTIPLRITGTPIVTVTSTLLTSGQTLASTTLTVVSPVAGTFAFNDSLSTIPTDGLSTYTGTFTPTDTVNFSSTTATVIVRSAAVLAGWNTSALTGGTNSFGTSPFNATVSNAGVTVGGFTRGTGISTTGTGIPRGWGGIFPTVTGADATARNTAAVTANTFITFTVKPTAAGSTMSLYSINPFGYRRVNANGPGTGAIQYSINGGAYATISNVTFTVDGLGRILPATNLTGIAALQNIPSTSTVTFRILLHSSTFNAANSSFYIYDVDNSTGSDLSVNGFSCVAPVAPTVSNSTVAFDNTAKSVTATVGAGATVDWYSTPTGGSAILSNSLTSPANTNAGTYTYYAEARNLGCSLVSASRTMVVLTISTVWNGTEWIGGTPTSTIDAVINGTYSTTSNGAILANNLTVNTSRTLTVNAGATVTVAAGLINNGSIVIENNANLIQTNPTNTNSGTGTSTVRRNSNALKRFDYTLWSSPVAVAGSKNLGGVNGFSPLTTQTLTSVRFYTYNPLTDKYTAAAVASPFALATGYLIRMPDQNPAILGNASEYYQFRESLVYNGEFTGTLNNGTITLTGLASDKFHAVGNPYPSTISATAFLNGNTTSGTLYFWRKANGVGGSAYALRNLAGGTNTIANSTLGEPDGSIQVGQGFIVKTGAATTSLTFTNAMRETTPTGSTFFKTKQTQKDRVWLNLTGADEAFSQALVAYIEDADLGLDKYDGKYINDSDIALTTSIAGDEYTIQGRPAFDATDVVALNFKTSVAGTYTIAIDHVDGLFSNGQAIYLVDKTTGTTTNLNEGAYKFTAEAGVDNTRFTLTYQKTLKIDAPLFNENSVLVSRNNGTLNVKSAAVAINNVKVFDVQGRLVAERKNVKSNIASFSNLKANQVLIVKVTSENNAVVTKKVLN